MADIGKAGAGQRQRPAGIANVWRGLRWLMALLEAEARNQ